MQLVYEADWSITEIRNSCGRLSALQRQERMQSVAWMLVSVLYGTATALPFVLCSELSSIVIFGSPVLLL